MRAILSVSDKTGLVDLARGLEGLGCELFSTGGTKKALVEAGVSVLSVSDLTGFPEILDGRVKTLHPAVHGGILAKRKLAAHVEELEKNRMGFIDLVAVNLYPFRETVARQGVALDEALENIDIGGPTMIRSGAKNHRHVSVIVDPADYETIIAEMRENQGIVSLGTNFRLAKKVFRMTGGYDQAISSYLESVEKP